MGWLSWESPKSKTSSHCAASAVSCVTRMTLHPVIGALAEQIEHDIAQRVIEGTGGLVEDEDGTLHSARPEGAQVVAAARRSGCFLLLGAESPRGEAQAFFEAQLLNQSIHKVFVDGGARDPQGEVIAYRSCEQEWLLAEVPDV